MKKINLLFKQGFDSTNKPEFIAFAKKFKNAIKKEIGLVKGELTAYRVGHFELSGFFRVRSHCYYFSFGDVRWGTGQLLWRRAKDEQDFTGGQNEYAALKDGMFEELREFQID
jgi:hypothetical protein